MGSIPLVALMGKPAPFENPTEQLERMAAIKSSQQQQQQSAALFPGQMQQQGINTQLGQQAIAAGALEAQRNQEINDAYKNAVTRNPDGTTSIDANAVQNALATSGHAAIVIPQVTKGLMDMQKLSGDLAAQKSDLASKEADAAGAAAQAILATGRQNPDGTTTYDPNVKAMVFQHLAAAGYQNEVQQIQNHLQQAPQTETQLWQSLTAASPKQQQLAIETQTAAAKSQEAATAAQKEKFEETQGGTNVDARELNDFMKNPPPGYRPTPTDFMRYKATVTPLAQINVANAAGGGLNQNAIDQAAQRYITTGQLPPAARGIAGLTQNRMIMNRAAELDPDGSIAGNAANYAANKKSLENVTGTLDTLQAFEKTGLANLKQFTDLASKLPDTGVPWLNTPIRLLNKNMVGAEYMPAIEAARSVALREIARVTNDPKLSGSLTDSARQEVSNFSPENATLPQIKHVVEVLRNDMANVDTNLSAQKADIQGRLGAKAGGNGTQQQTQPQQQSGPPPGATHIAPGSDGKRHYTNSQGQDLGIAP